MTLVNIYGRTVKILFRTGFAILFVVDFYRRNRIDFGVCKFVRFRVKSIRIGLVNRLARTRRYHVFVSVVTLYAVDGNLEHSVRSTVHYVRRAVPAVKVAYNAYARRVRRVHPKRRFARLLVERATHVPVRVVQFAFVKFSVFACVH